MTKVSVGIIYPADPVGTIPGGIDTFIRGILRWAPPDICVDLIGVTTDRLSRPVGTWTRCDLEKRSFNFFPVSALDDASYRGRVPLSLRFTIALAAYRIEEKFDVLEFHRIEPSILFLLDRRPKNAFVHQNMNVLLDTNADIAWRRAPWLFFKLEDWLLPKMASVFVVRENAVATYRARYPAVKDRFNFIPTWFDPDVFFPLANDQKMTLKNRLVIRFGWAVADPLLIWVGRLDKQKDPFLMIETFYGLSGRNLRLRLIVVGDGVLRSAVQGRIDTLGLSNRIALVGLRSVTEVADLLRVSDIFVLSSAYEGMPMCVLEALGSGVPVAATDVGEIRLVVKPGQNGEISNDRSPEALGSAIVSCYNNLDKYSGAPCLESVAAYVPEKVLAPVYENYRRLATENRETKI